MPSVVIAGGTSPSLGRSLVISILAHAPTWHPTVLSRPSSRVPAWLAPLVASARVTLARASYADHAGLVAALRAAHAHTVICALGFTPASAADGSWAAAQLCLLAAARAAGARRFAPAEFGVGVRASPSIELLCGNVEVWRACEESGLEWTRYECGLFMNYLGFGVDGARREEALGGRERDGECFYYVSACRAELPVGDGGAFPRVTLTAVQDVGKFVARTLDLPAGSWETTSYMVGETLRMDEVVRIAEKVMGKTWKIETVSPEEFERRIEGLGEEKDAGAKMWAQLGLCYTRDAEGEGWLDGRLNELFPDVKPLTVEEYFRKYYG